MTQDVEPVKSAAEVLAALRLAIITSANDNYSVAGTVERRRYCQRMEAMADAVALIEHLSRESHLFTLAEMGWKIVPAEADDAMVIAALESSRKIMAQHSIDRLSPNDTYPSPSEVTRKAYRAMIEAAQDGFLRSVTALTNNARFRQ